MVSLRYLNPLVFALGLAARPSHAQQADLAPLLPRQVLPQLPAAPNEVVVRRAAPPAPGLPPSSAVVAPRQPGPLFLLNSRLFVGPVGLGKINPQDIDKVIVYKGGYPTTDTPVQWRGLDMNGIIAITLKKHVKARLKSQSLAQLARHLQAQGTVSYSINGLPAASGALRVATVSIAEMKLVRTPGGTTVGVWLQGGLSQGEPSQLTKIYPPGTIMIRGMASR